MRILVVDDEDAIVTILSAFLNDRGYEVISAGSGDEALELVRSDPEIGVVLMDVIMPGRSGLDVLREIMQRHPHPHVIMMTARADDKIFEAVRLGAVDYLLKPIDFEALDATMAASFKPAG
jgi:DNA-binding NtrC family response regulator